MADTLTAVGPDTRVEAQTGACAGAVKACDLPSRESATRQLRLAELDELGESPDVLVGEPARRDAELRVSAERLEQRQLKRSFGAAQRERDDVAPFEAFRTAERVADAAQRSGLASEAQHRHRSKHLAHAAGKMRLRAGVPVRNPEERGLIVVRAILSRLKRVDPIAKKLGLLSKRAELRRVRAHGPIIGRVWRSAKELVAGAALERMAGPPSSLNHKINSKLDLSVSSAPRWVNET